MHIAHEYDDDGNPWPIFIEDHKGNLISVALKEGEMMFYESAKCLHGRMRILRGRYYGSIFLHYKPADMSKWSYTEEDVVNAVPPHWNEGISAEHGSRWAGQAITVDSRAVDNAPPREDGEGYAMDAMDMEDDHEQGQEQEEEQWEQEQEGDEEL